ncbi:MAG: hypothetical protein QNM02_16535, partial [Acidimicrobiia bacterium]|nr:hypothetical protein [Acidimicrobiia bacterium]
TTDAPGTDPEGTEPATTEPATTDAVATDAAEVETGLPAGVMNFSTAEELALDIDFGPRCDPVTGLVAVPSFFAPECFLPFEGDNGGETAQGVSGDSIKIVWWVAQDQDPILNFVTQAIVNDDTNADDEDTVRGMIEYSETYYETYGRNVELIVMEGSGTIVDEAAARADAVRIAEDMQPFMVWGGPLLTNAFAEELAARGVPCMSCGPSQDIQFYIDNPMLNYGIGKSGQQLNLLVAEYIGKRLAGDPAIHAGDESMHEQERSFGRIWLESSPASAELNQVFEDTLAGFDVEVTESQSYLLDPATLQESAASIISRMKEAGVTSVIINGDPVAPREITNEATAQNYFPEWIVTGSVLIDTTAFARTYDQEQWSNAFGISNLAARIDRTKAGSHFLYEWFHGAPPAADDNIGVITPTPGTFYAVLQGVGPNLTIETFNEAFFAGEPTRSALTAGSLDWGDTGRWPAGLEPDYFGTDDISEIWWDPNEVGLDEIDKEGVGMWRWIDGGLRYLLGEIPVGAPDAFVMEGSVAIYAERPAGEAIPDDYVPLKE